MLVLTRLRNESLLIGAARVTVKSIEGHETVLSVEAPSGTCIRPTELHDPMGRKPERNGRSPDPLGEPSRLILIRRRNESIRIGEDVWVTVVDTRSDNVRLGVTAPRSCLVLRNEVLERMKARAANDGPEEPVAVGSADDESD